LQARFCHEGEPCASFLVMGRSRVHSPVREAAQRESVPRDSVGSDTTSAARVWSPFSTRAERGDQRWQRPSSHNAIPPEMRKSGSVERVPSRTSIFRSPRRQHSTGSRETSRHSTQPKKSTCSTSPEAQRRETREAKSKSRGEGNHVDVLKRENQELKMQVQALRDEQTRTAQLHSQFLAAINKKNEDLEDWLMNLRARHDKAGSSATSGARRGVTPDACSRHAAFGQEDYRANIDGSHLAGVHTEVLRSAFPSDQPGLASAAANLMENLHGQMVGSANSAPNTTSTMLEGTDTMRSSANSSSSTGIDSVGSEPGAAEGSSGMTAVPGTSSSCGLSSSESISIGSGQESFGTSVAGRPRLFQGMILGQEESITSSIQNPGASYSLHLQSSEPQVPTLHMPQVTQLPMRTSMPRTSLRGRVSSSMIGAKEPTPVRRTLGGDQSRMNASPNPSQATGHNNSSGGLSPRGVPQPAASGWPGSTSPRRTQTTQVPASPQLPPRTATTVGAVTASAIGACSQQAVCWQGQTACPSSPCPAKGVTRQLPSMSPPATPALLSRSLATTASSGGILTGTPEERTHGTHGEMGAQMRSPVFTLSPSPVPQQQQQQRVAATKTVGPPLENCLARSTSVMTFRLGG